MKAALVAIVALVAACGGGGGGGGDDTGGDDIDGSVDGNGAFDAATTMVAIEIDYESGNAPYTGQVLGFGDTFDLLVANLERLFSGTRTLSVPTTTAAMEDIGPVGDEQLTVTDLLALADQHRDTDDVSGTKTYYVVFVSGNYADGSGVQSGVLGVSIGSTGVIAMFKDVIESTGLPAFPNLERFVEQSTLIHELGHAIGLVDNGVPMVSDHKDEAHGAHCTNQDCVMFWLNEGASDMADFAGARVLSSDVILFGAECLADVDALTGGP